MKITKSEQLDIAYVQLRRGKVKETVELSQGLLIDLDKDGNILGIEILSLKKLAPRLNVSIRKVA